MSGLPAQNGPLTGDESFDQEWAAALSGELASSGSTLNQEAEPVDQQSVAPAPAPTAPFAPAAAAQPSEVPDHLLRAAREAGYQSVDEALKAARQFQSIVGNLPQMEENWKQKHLTPLQQELQTLRAERQEAMESFIKYDPATGFPRPQEEQAALRQRAAQAEQQQQEAENQRLEQQQFAEARQQLQAEKAQVEQAKTSTLKLVAINSLTPYRDSLAKEYKVPVSEIQQYLDATDFVAQVQALDDMHGFGPLLAGLENHVRVRAQQIQAQKQRDSRGRYRDVGQPGGTGGQSGANRWAQMSDAEFDVAWEAAKAGRLS